MIHVPTNEEIEQTRKHDKAVRERVEEFISPFQDEYKTFAKDAIEKAFEYHGGKDNNHLWRSLFFSDHYMMDSPCGTMTNAYTEYSISKGNVKLRLCAICLSRPKKESAVWSHQLTSSLIKKGEELLSNNNDQP